MKSFEYNWCEEYFLLHLQFHNPGRKAFTARICREFIGQEFIDEEIPVVEGTSSHRVMVSRSHPRETKFQLEYPVDVTLEVFQLDDRAYYPTETFYHD